MVDHKTVKLGKRAVKFDSRTLRLGKYFLSTLPPAPPKVQNSRGINSWGGMLNDKYSDCTIAGIGHIVQVWTLASTGKMVTLPDDVILDYYSKFDGFDPKNVPATDQGGVEIDVLNQWRQQTVAGHVLSAYAEINPQHLDNVKQAINIFGGVYVGLELPLSAQGQKVWTDNFFKRNATAPGSWGGHCVVIVDYDSDAGTFTCITWGELQVMKVKFFTQYCSECYALLSPDWLTSGKSILGLDMQSLLSDLNVVTA